MEFHEDNEIFLSQIISGMLLFNREFTFDELFDVMSILSNGGFYYINDQISCYDEVYQYLDDLGNKYRLKFGYDYNSLIEVDNIKMTLFNYLRSNTTDEIISFLINKFHQDINVIKKYENKMSFNMFDIFHKEKKFKKRKKISM